MANRQSAAGEDKSHHPRTRIYRRLVADAATLLINAFNILLIV